MIRTKRQNFALWQAGAFGNKLRAWRTVEEWRASGFRERVVLRVLLPAGGGPHRYNLEPGEVDQVVEEWVLGGIPLGSIMVNEAAPDTRAILQGEYRNGFVDGRMGYLLYSRLAKHMHIALGLRSEVARGLQADLLLRSAMTPSSYSDWQVLLDRYPDHVLEVSVYSCCLGDTPDRNTLVWEVRCY